MFPKLPQSYNFTYFFLSKNFAMGGPSSHGPQGSSLPLSSPCNSDPSNVDDDDMSLDELDANPETNLPHSPIYANNLGK
jgi:hypothetical protein